MYMRKQQCECVKSASKFIFLVLTGEFYRNLCDYNSQIHQQIVSDGN